MTQEQPKTREEILAYLKEPNTMFANMTRNPVFVVKYVYEKESIIVTHVLHGRSSKEPIDQLPTTKHDLEEVIQNILQEKYLMGKYEIIDPKVLREASEIDSKLLEGSLLFADLCTHIGAEKDWSEKHHLIHQAIDLNKVIAELLRAMHFEAIKNDPEKEGGLSIEKLLGAIFSKDPIEDNNPHSFGNKGGMA